MSTNYAAVTLSADDLQSALDLLSEEQRAGRRDRRKLALSLVNSLAVGIFLLCVPLGLLIIWFDTLWGVALLAIGAASLVVVGVTAPRTPGEETTRLRKAMEGTEISRVSTEVWEKVAAPFEISLAITFFLGGFAVLGGLAWLMYDLVTTDQVPIGAIALIVVPPLVFWTVFAVMEYRELEHYEDVSQALGRLRHASAQAEDQGLNEVPLTGDEFAVLSRAEEQQAKRQIVQAVETLPQAAEQLYSLVIAQEPLDQLVSLSTANPDAYSAIRKDIDRLLTDPHPAGSKVVRAGSPSEGDVLVMDCGSRSVTYDVDEGDRRVSVIAIDWQRSNDASG
jgi:hypothetical protein